MFILTENGARARDSSMMNPIGEPEESFFFSGADFRRV
jgi:hypothetical protein